MGVSTSSAWMPKDILETFQGNFHSCLGAFRLLTPPQVVQAVSALTLSQAGQISGFLAPPSPELCR